MNLQLEWKGVFEMEPFKAGSIAILEDLNGKLTQNGVTLILRFIIIIVAGGGDTVSI